MSLPQKRYSAPPNSGPVQLGYTLPALLDEVCHHHPNPHAFQQWSNNRWQSISNQSFQLAAEEVALGLLDLKLTAGDRVSLFMQSDFNFCIADMGCLLAGLVDVPIDLGLNSEAIQFILQHTESKAVITSNLDGLRQLAPCLGQTPNLSTVIVVDAPADWLPKLPKLPPGLQVMTLEAVRAKGRLQWSDQSQSQLRSRIAPEDLATIVYTAGPTEQPRGVMLSHSSLSGDVLAAFGGIPELKPGVTEVALLFLPLTHVFARAFLYGHLYYSHRIYFTTATRVTKHLREVQPTIFITVPRLLEKAYEKILENGNQLSGWRRMIFQWALSLAQQYPVGQPPRGCYALQLKLADRLVFSQWRSGFGGRIKYLISGGAALRAELTNVFTAAGVPILQGYGLTESSAVLCYNRGELNRAGTVGVPIAGVELAIGEDGEILAQTPYRMNGYYKDPEATEQAIDREGWLHTGDLGEFTSDGFLKITGCKKNLFKLSTGKYISPLPIEQQLRQSPLVKQAIVVGAHRKFCALLIFPDLDYLCDQAEGMCLNLATEKLLGHPRITALYQALIDKVNQQLPHWSTIKQFRLLHLTLTTEQGVRTPALILKRDLVNQIFATEIDAMYAEQERVAKANSAKSEASPANTEAPAQKPTVKPIFLKFPVSLQSWLLRPLPLRITPSQAGGSSNEG